MPLPCTETVCPGPPSASGTWITAKRSPPRPHISGITTAATSPAATAASTAFPPWRRMSKPASEVSGWAAPTIPRSAYSGQGRRRAHPVLAVGVACGKPIMVLTPVGAGRIPLHEESLCRYPGVTQVQQEPGPGDTEFSSALGWRTCSGRPNEEMLHGRCRLDNCKLRTELLLQNVLRLSRGASKFRELVRARRIASLAIEGAHGLR